MEIPLTRVSGDETPRVCPGHGDCGTRLAPSLSMGASGAFAL